MAKKKASTSKKKSTTTKKKSGVGLITAVGGFLRNQRTRRVTGLFLCVSAILLSIAYLSYMFTWQADQSILMGDLSSSIADKTVRVKNWLGQAGASISHFSFYHGFGVSSFVFPFLLAVFGLKAISGKYPLPIWKTLGISVFLLFWSSLFFGYFFQSRFILVEG